MDSPDGKRPHTAAALPPSPPLSFAAPAAADDVDSDPDAAAPAASLQVNRVIDAISLRERHPALAAPWETFSLSPPQYKKLLRSIKADDQLAGFVDTKGRLEYDSNAHEVTLRMPGAVHEVFASAIGIRIHENLATLAQTYPALRRALNGVTNAGTRTIKLDDTDDHLLQPSRSPDLQFQYLNRRWPSIVIEVAYSQKAHALPRIASDYLHGSEGNIHAVVAFDLGYQSPEDRLEQEPTEARVLVWREGAVTNDKGDEESDAVLAVDEPFRTGSGAPADGGLTLPISDFVPVRTLRNLGCPTDVAFTIEYGDLAADLAGAERIQKVDDTESGEVDPPRRSWRKRKFSPVEEGSEDAERDAKRLNRSQMPVRRRRSVRLRESKMVRGLEAQSSAA